MGFGFPRRLYEYGPEKLSNKHTQSKWIFFKKEKKNPQSIYITEEKERSSVSLRLSLSFPSLSLFTFPPVPTEYSHFLDNYEESQRKSDRDALSYKYH